MSGLAPVPHAWRCAALAAALWLAAAPAAAQEPVVSAVLFYSPTCPHCHEVINRHLPPLRERYGERLVVVGVDVTTPGGAKLYEAAVEYYGLAPDRLGVPLLVVGEVALLGSQEIPDRLPGLIEDGLAAGGTPWPTLPALREALTAQGIIPAAPAPPPTREAPREPASVGARDTTSGGVRDTTPETAPAASPATASPEAAGAHPAEAPDSSETPVEAPAGLSETPVEAPAGPSGSDAEAPSTLTPLEPGADPMAPPTAAQRFLQDPAGNGIAVAVLLVLLAVLVLSTLAVRGTGAGLPPFPVGIVPTLATAGLAIAVYLSVVEVTGASAVCGPVGDCNAVQQSPYALLFGIVPVGLLGAAGYVAILVAWAAATFGPAGSVRQARLALWIFAFTGTAFSAYLTFLEPFVIGATCAWCVSSALIMAVLLLSAAGDLRRGRSTAP